MLVSWLLVGFWRVVRFYSFLESSLSFLMSFLVWGVFSLLWGFVVLFRSSFFCLCSRGISVRFRSFISFALVYGLASFRVRFSMSVRWIFRASSVFSIRRARLGGGSFLLFR